MSWKHLVTYHTAHGTQVRLKGRCHLTAKAVVGAMRANGWNVERAANNFNVCHEAVEECLAYCQGRERVTSQAAVGVRVK